MKKNIRPIINSETRVKSMFDFMKEEENADAQNVVNVGDIDSKESTTGDSTKPNNGAVILQRSRGDVVVDNTESKDDALVDSNSRGKASFVEIQSETYDGQPKEVKKITVKEWFQNLGVKIAQGWDNFIHKKGAVRLLTIIAIMVILAIALSIYVAVTRTDIRDLFANQAKAFIMNEIDDSGNGYTQDIDISDLVKGEPASKNTAGYQQIEFLGKDINKDVYINRLAFYIYTETTDLTLNIKLTMYDGDEVIWEVKNAKTYDLGQRIAKRVTFDYIGNVNITNNTRMVIEFEAIKTSDKNNNIITNYDVDFSIFKLEYN